MSRTPAQRANLNPPQEPGQPPLNPLGRVFGSRPTATALRDFERALVRGYAPELATLLGQALTSPQRLLKVLKLIDTLYRRDEARRAAREAKQAARRLTAAP